MTPFPVSFAEKVALALAQLAAGSALFIAAFRGTAGIRSGLLLLAASIIVFIYGRRQEWRLLIPPFAFFWVTTLAWVAVVFALSLWGPNPAESLRSWRGDILTPLLSLLIFFVLTRNREVMQRWVAVLFGGLLILAAMVIADPFQGDILKHRPKYVTVGLLTMWLITLAPLLPFAWHAKRSERRAFRLLAISASLSLVLGGLFSGNRVIWVCYAAMLVLGLVIAESRQPNRMTKTHRVGWGVAVLASLIALFALSSWIRAHYQGPEGTGAVKFLLQDSRSEIWSQGVGMFMERPWLGHGYALDAVREAYAARFSDPWFQQVFKHPHNLVLHYLIQVGIVGTMVLLAWFAALTWIFWRMSQGNAVARLAGTVGLMLVLGVFMRNMVDDFFNRHTMLLFASLAGMLLGLGANAQKHQPLPAPAVLRKEANG